MANDSFGVKKIYPDSTRNPSSYYLQGPGEDARLKLVDDGTGTLTRNTNNVYSIINPGHDPTLEILTTAGYQSSLVEKDHSKAASKTFMMNTKDWRNVECTVYVKVSSATSNKGIAWVCRGGVTTFKSAGNCEACGYMAYLRYAGQTVFSKIEHRGSVNNSPLKSVTSDLEGRWVGFKFCVFNFADDNPGVDVGLELWIDENESNSWRKVNSFSDRGSWGSKGAACGGTASQVLSFGGPVVSLIISDASAVEFKKLSVREIVYNGVFNEGGSNSGAGQENGGTGSTGSGSTGGNTNPGTGAVSRCTSTQTNTISNSSTQTRSNSGTSTFTSGGTDTSGVVTNSNPVITSSNNNSNTPATQTGNTGGGGGNVDRHGVQSAYARGQIRYDFRENFRGDGLRFDFTGFGSSFASAELMGYFRNSSSVDDEVSGKMGGGKHSSGSRPRCYDLGIDCGNGAVRYRVEDKHPSTGGGKSGPGSGQGGGVGFTNRWVGYRFVKRNLSNGVLLEIWQDQGNNAGNAPANQWKKIMSHVDTQHNWKIPPSDHQETIRIDDVSTGSLDWKWLSLREIGASDSGTAATPQNSSNSISTSSGSGSGPFDGGTGGGGSSSGGGGGGSCSCDSGTPSSSTGTGNDMCDSNGDGIADTPGSGGGAQPEPPPIETLTSDFTVLYNIAVDVTDSCTFGNPLEVKPYESVYDDAAPDAFQYQDLGYQAGSGNTAVGLIVANTESVLYNTIPRKIVVKAIKRTVDSETETCSGDLYMRVRNTVDNSLKYQFGTEVDVATIGVNDQDLTFTQDDNKVQLKVGDMILLEYLNNSAADDKCIQVKHTEKDKTDGVNTYLVYRRSTGYVFSDRDKDFSVDIFT